MEDVTYILSAIESGRATTADLLPLVYDALRRMAPNRMQNEQPGHTLQPTALVHEAFLRLVGTKDAVDGNAATWQNRRHFFGAAAIAMQRILVDEARRKKQLQHGGDHMQVQLSDVDVAQSTVAPKIWQVCSAIPNTRPGATCFSDQQGSLSDERTDNGSTLKHRQTGCDYRLIRNVATFSRNARMAAVTSSSNWHSCKALFISSIQRSRAA